MSIFRSLLDALFRDRTSTTLTVVIPTTLVMGLETLAYLRNVAASEEEQEIDRDYLVGVAIATYLQRHLYDKNEKKISSIPTPPPPPTDEYTNGRKQSRTNYQ